jgi:hypothetical protein
MINLGISIFDAMTEEEKRLTEEEFITQAIKKLRKDPYRGIHSVYSGFNEAFRKYFF